MIARNGIRVKYLQLNLNDDKKKSLWQLVYTVIGSFLAFFQGFECTGMHNCFLLLLIFTSIYFSSDRFTITASYKVQ